MCMVDEAFKCSDIRLHLKRGFEQKFVFLKGTKNKYYHQFLKVPFLCSVLLFKTYTQYAL